MTQMPKYTYEKTSLCSLCEGDFIVSLEGPELDWEILYVDNRADYEGRKTTIVYRLEKCPNEIKKHTAGRNTRVLLRTGENTRGKFAEVEDRDFHLKILASAATTESEAEPFRCQTFKLSRLGKSPDEWEEDLLPWIPTDDELKGQNEVGQAIITKKKKRL